MSTKNVKVEYFGYQGHFICRCDFHLTTIISNDTVAVMVSTIGKMRDELEKRWMPVGAGRLFETEVFAAFKDEFWEANVFESLEGGRYYTISSDEELLILQNKLPLNEYNEIFNNLEKEADRGHKEVVNYWVRKLGSSEI